jgi:small basic protein
MSPNINPLDSTGSFSILSTTQLREFFLIYFAVSILANLFAALSISYLFTTTGIQLLLVAVIVLGFATIAAWALLNLIMVLVELSHRICDDFVY